MVSDDGEASAGTEAARSLPEWLVRGLTAGELTPERIREALGLDPSAGAEEIFAALSKRPLEDETAGYLAALYLGAVIAGGTASPDPSEALEGLRQLLEKIASGVEPDAAVEELTGGAFTGLEDFSEQFTGLTAPGLRQFLLDFLTPELGGPEAPVLSGMPLMNLLAGMEGVRYRENTLQLHPGDQLYLYTDGVTEATDLNKELFGEERLLAVLNEEPDLPVEEPLPKIKARIDQFAGEAEQFDDITMLSLLYSGREEQEDG